MGAIGGAALLGGVDTSIMAAVLGAMFFLGFLVIYVLAALGG